MFMGQMIIILKVKQDGQIENPVEIHVLYRYLKMCIFVIWDLPGVYWSTFTYHLSIPTNIQ